MTDAIGSTKSIITMASAVADYCKSEGLTGQTEFERVARRVIEIYGTGIIDVRSIVTEMKRLDLN